MTRRSIVMLTALVAVVAFAAAGYAFWRYDAARRTEAAAGVSNTFVRPHSPVLGPANAPVTIVEFFDPACESCRAFYPVVKQIMAAHPEHVKLVIRYAPFHQGSEEAVRILETARLQGRYQPVLEGLLESQPRWASHGAPRIDRAWDAARVAGLDVARARQDMAKPAITEMIKQDVADLKAAGVKGTPTFFVNEKPLLSFGAQQLEDLVRREVAAVKARIAQR